MSELFFRFDYILICFGGGWQGLLFSPFFLLSHAQNPEKPQSRAGVIVKWFLRKSIIYSFDIWAVELAHGDATFMRAARFQLPTTI